MAEKMARTVAKRSFTLAHKEFMKGLDLNVQSVILQKRFDLLHQAWLDVSSKHATYLAAAYGEDDAPEEEDQWMDKVASE